MHRALLSLALLAVLFSATPATAGNMPTNSCTQLGATMMSDDKENIIACTLVAGTTGTAPSCADKAGAANNKCKWKSMSVGSAEQPQGTFCGHANIYKATYCVGTCTTQHALISQKPCLGTNLFTPTYAISNPATGWLVKEASTGFTANCPNGYSPIGLGSYGTTSGYPATANHLYSCIKN